LIEFRQTVDAHVASKSRTQNIIYKLTFYSIVPKSVLKSPKSTYRNEGNEVRVSVAFLADYASIQEDGNKVHVLGAGIESLTARTFPLVQANLALVMKLAFDQHEWGLVHVIQVRTTDEAGNELQPQRAISIVPQPPAEVVPAGSVSPGGQATVSLPIVHNMRDLQFPKPGRYDFAIVLPDGASAATLQLQVAGSTDEASLQTILTAGYNAFVEGETEKAWAIFDEALKTAPGSPDAHNDYGFLNLSRGRPSEALVLFERARELGYELTELLDANIACCHYLLGKYQGAFAEFRRLMGSEFQNTPSVLFALDRDGIVAVELQIAVHFISLMALNAGYAALRSGLVDDATQFAQIAAAGRITFTEQRDAEAFVRALDHLLEECQRQASTPKNRK
jgi:hypothetical protein